METINIKIDSMIAGFEEDIFEENNIEAVHEIKRISEKYGFFNYEIEFPESYNSGFDIIIGNPPWDKVKFDDKDFFSQYRSNYRTMSVSEKKETQNNLLKSILTLRLLNILQMNLESV